MKVISISIKVLVFFSLFFVVSSFIFFEETNETKTPKDNDPEFIKYKSKWIDSVFNSLSLEERIGQLIMVAAYSNLGKEHQQNIENIIKTYKPGGLIFFQGGPVRQAQLTNHYQKISKTPLFIAQDAEWGPSMRLDSTVVFPRQMMLGAIQDDKILYDFGLEVGRECNRLGVHINFAPVLDVNNNSANPVINSRSFGEERLNVAQKGFAYMFGMQSKKLITTAKHFPGHGDTESDSHKTLPVINHTVQRLDSIELFPFKYLINNGLTGIMVGHLHVPALDSSPNSASSLSKEVITGLLKDNLGFKGLIFTDALGMQGVSSYNAPGAIALKTFMAGTDVLVMPQDIGAAINEIKSAVSSGLISEDEVNQRCYKILQAKKWAGLDNYSPVQIENLVADLNNSEAQYTRQKLIESAITLVENKNEIIPFKKIDSVKIASVSIGSGNISVFQKTMDLYDNVNHFTIEKNADINAFKSIINKLVDYDIVVIAFQKTNNSPSSFGITNNSVWFAHEMAKYTKVVPVIFANPYTLARFNRKKMSAIIMSYEDSELSQNFSAQLLYGGIAAKGKLPVSAGPEYPSRTGISDEKIRVKYAIPRELNINELRLKKIDSIVTEAIDARAFPGCQIVAIKNGIVFYNKSFGYHTYEKKTPVNNYDLYDLASVTKISATMPAIMKFNEEGKIDLAAKMSKYIKELESSNKKNITVKQVLAHQARLIGWLPLYLKTFERDTSVKYILNPEIYSSKQDSEYSVRVAENMFMKKNYIDTIYKKIYDSPLRRRAGYFYSDLGFYLFYKIISERLTKRFPDYLESIIYAPMGLTTMCYNPIDKFPKERIIPTEMDKKFRKQLIQGYVHDYGAAMMGGICGHAGLFSNANDLAKLMQMFLQKGEYGGERYFAESTIELFTNMAYSKSRNRRALGFDRPGTTKKSPVSSLASPLSFGHTGFTGTIAWVDPKEQFVYVFLSNRIYPDIENNRISSLHVRSRIHEVFYKSFM
ncbi:MAG: glycoside hydrolase family 3 N-terminal domain-containing protein [Bacteroidales bacterium]